MPESEVGHVVACLHLDIQNANLTLLCNIVDSLDARSVVVASKLRMLNKPLLFNQVEELFLGHEVVLLAILFGPPGCARRVGYAKAKLSRKLFEEAREDGGFSSAGWTTDYNGLVR